MEKSDSEVRADRLEYLRGLLRRTILLEVRYASMSGKPGLHPLLGLGFFDVYAEQILLRDEIAELEKQNVGNDHKE